MQFPSPKQHLRKLLLTFEDIQKLVHQRNSDGLPLHTIHTTLFSLRFMHSELIAKHLKSTLSGISAGFLQLSFQSSVPTFNPATVISNEPPSLTSHMRI